jgi:hypothetical protein
MKSMFIILLLISITACKLTVQQKYIPVTDGGWRQVAGNPDLGKYSDENQQPVDFCVWQAKDATWQLWSCIRGTKCGEKTRLFYGWESRLLTGKDWQPTGIAMEADTALGETSGGLQAPYVFKEGGMFYMIYGDWGRICLAASRDGKKFERVLNDNGGPDLFAGPYMNTRDPMIYREDGLYYCYYMGHTDPDGMIPGNGQMVKKIFKSAIFCRTSADLKHWSEPVMVSAGGEAGNKGRWHGGNAECPFVLKKGDYYYLFRNQEYGENNLNTQYASLNPFDFGVGHDFFRISTLPVAAPEIVYHKGEYYIFALNPGLDGIRMAKLKWVPVN